MLAVVSLGIVALTLNWFDVATAFPLIGAEFVADHRRLEVGQAPGDDRAGADGDPRRGDALRFVERDDRRHHDDRDHQIAAGAELEEGRAGDPSVSGTRMAVTISSGAFVVSRLPVTNSSTGTRRMPRREASSISASSASRFGVPSAAGEALHRLPHSVPAFWIWTPPTAPAARFSPSNSGGSAGLAMIRTR